MRHAASDRSRNDFTGPTVSASSSANSRSRSTETRPVPTNAAANVSRLFLISKSLTFSISSAVNVVSSSIDSAANNAASHTTCAAIRSVVLLRSFAFSSKSSRSDASHESSASLRNAVVAAGSTENKNSNRSGASGVSNTSLICDDVSSASIGETFCASLFLKRFFRNESTPRQNCRNAFAFDVCSALSFPFATSAAVSRTLLSAS
mmetsp:Transcript_8797/g.28855  ORF Transcript_8797/g.28855 Transcript_8797/m.28855 type:complete len:206 (+) Transcript_8797:1516-2133(+)